jgi:hypothetical protein
MSLKSEQENDALLPFPNGNNVRITIGGLATCQFTPDTSRPSLFHFVPTARLHKLMVVVKRRNTTTGNVETVLQETPINYRANNISVFGDTMTNPGNYQHTPQAGEFHLNELLHLSNRHNVRFTRNTRPVPTLRLDHCSYYVKSLTYDSYFVFVLENPGSLQLPKKIGEVLGAYMTASGNIHLEVDGRSLYQGLITDQAINYEYEIAFTNHCNELPEICKNALGGSGSDVKFLYDILNPPKPDVTKIMLLKMKIDIGTQHVGMTPNVVACLPGTTEP